MGNSLLHTRERTSALITNLTKLLTYLAFSHVFCTLAIQFMKNLGCLTSKFLNYFVFHPISPSFKKRRTKAANIIASQVSKQCLRDHTNAFCLLEAHPQSPKNDIIDVKLRPHFVSADTFLLCRNNKKVGNYQISF